MRVPLQSLIACEAEIFEVLEIKINFIFFDGGLVLAFELVDQGLLDLGFDDKLVSVLVDELLELDVVLLVLLLPLTLKSFWWWYLGHPGNFGLANDALKGIGIQYLKLFLDLLSSEISFQPSRFADQLDTERIIHIFHASLFLFLLGLLDLPFVHGYSFDYVFGLVILFELILIQPYGQAVVLPEQLLVVVLWLEMLDVADVRVFGKVVSDQGWARFSDGVDDGAHHLCVSVDWHVPACDYVAEPEVNHAWIVFTMVLPHSFSRFGVACVLT